MKKYIDIGSRREVFWDDTLLDTEKTATTFKLHEPIVRECVLTPEPPCTLVEDGGYLCVLQDGDLYRMYVMLVGNVFYAESKDGIHWEQPSLGIVEINGSTDNSALFDLKTLHEDGKERGFDGFRVFIDDNPRSKPEERYKAVADFHQTLYIFVSPDGIHFKKQGPMSIKGFFDSMNTIFYNKQTDTYQAFIRNFHAPSVPCDIWIRDIRFTESKELYPPYPEVWPVPKQLEYENLVDWQLYTNSIMKYYRADHVYIGFPTRYVQRKQWTGNYDELCGRKTREERFREKDDTRYALAITDTQFMTSRDGLHWKLYGEAFLRPGPEYPENWIYGSVYFSNGIVETKSAHPGCDNELSFYCVENRWSENLYRNIRRYTIRLDGFVSQNAPATEADLVTKPFVFEGNELYVNFSTSAYGYMKIKLTDEEGHSITSCETFGDSVDRRVHFEGDLAAFAGKPVVMSIHMCDADIYSFQFR